MIGGNFSEAKITMLMARYQKTPNIRKTNTEQGLMRCQKYSRRSGRLNRLCDWCYTWTAFIKSG
jgi:hypothetical protein